MKKTLTAAQIGCGKFARSQDFPNMAKHPDVTLKWACDVNPDNAKTAAEQFHVPETTTDFMEVVNDPEVDMIKIATTHEAHLPIIEAAAKAGKHIFCEKPMAKHDKEAYLIMKAVRRSGIKLCVDLNRRMSPAMQALRRKWLDHAENPIHNPWRYIEKQREPLPEENLPHSGRKFILRHGASGSAFGRRRDHRGKRSLAGPRLLVLCTSTALRNHGMGFIAPVARNSPAF